jgi:predicted DNA-binding transcriptional regulator AlpA
MANPSPKPISNTTAVVYCEQQVDDWLRAKVRGEPWRLVVPRQPTFIRRREVVRRVGLTYPTIWKMERDGTFPRPIRLNEISRDAA